MPTSVIEIDAISDCRASIERVSYLVKSKLKWGLISVALILCAVLIYSKGRQLEARIWHWRNGDFARIGAYEVPVPRSWTVETTPGSIVLIDASSELDQSTRNVITILIESPAVKNLEGWKLFRRRSLKESGTDFIVDRSFPFANGQVSCLGGHELKRIRGGEKIVSAECWSSSGDLCLIFAGNSRDLEVLYSIIPNVRKHST